MVKLVVVFLLLLHTLMADIVKNDLQYETSPYLKQHETNPVHWMAWKKKAFDLAKKENKPIFLSIGYSTCHWCHVMSEESFTNKHIAQLLNKDFISIKVDREELPQIDSYFQEIYFKTHKRRGGWPLNVFLTPNRTPFFISTYLPPKRESYSEGLDTLLPKIALEFKNDYKSILLDIQKMKNSSTFAVSENKAISVKTLSESLLEEYDSDNGGFGNGKKFPQAAKLSLMMDLASLTKSKTLFNNSYKMLDAMALKGLYDHVGGGFYRYTSEADWEIAHFEKMLYNQAELIPLYARAYDLTRKPLYASVVRETVAMLDKRFLHDNYYFSASDADSKNGEGAFFTFTKKEINDALQKNVYKEELEDSLGFVTEGNFRGRVHLNFYTESRPKGFKAFRDELLKIQSKRQFPFVDKKINTAWNAMMIEALYKASSIDIKYIAKADKHLDKLKTLMFDKGELYHQTLSGLKPTQKGLLEDYSFFIAALIAGYEVDYDNEKLNFAIYLLSQAKAKFYKNGMWYLSDDGMKISDSLTDKYYTSPVSKMLQNIIKLASIKESFKYDKLAEKTLKGIDNKLRVMQSDAPAAATAYLMQHLKVVTVKSNKKNLLKECRDIKKIKYPYVVKRSIEEKRYLGCTLRTCFAIENSIDKLIESIDNSKGRF